MMSDRRRPYHRGRPIGIEPGGHGAAGIHPLVPDRGQESSATVGHGGHGPFLRAGVTTWEA